MNKKRAQWTEKRLWEAWIRLAVRKHVTWNAGKEGDKYGETMLVYSRRECLKVTSISGSTKSKVLEQVILKVLNILL